MKAEIMQILRAPLYWLVLLAGLGARASIAVLDFRYRPEQAWLLAGEFWSRAGSVTMCLLILVVLIRLFSVDYETGAVPVVASTPLGRRSLYFFRLAAGCAMTVLGTALLVAGNIGITVVLGRGVPAGWIRDFTLRTVPAAVGSVGYFLVSAFVCDIFANQPAAMAVCGIPFAVSYFINTGMIEAFDLFWFLRCGFFTELARGRWIASRPGFWIAWYVLLIAGFFVLSIYRRKERKLL